MKEQSAVVHRTHTAEDWAAVLRDRRNALHWGKNKSLTAEHADTGTLMMAAPMHMKTLEAIRLAC
jgi:hypothetical protein